MSTNIVQRLNSAEISFIAAFLGVVGIGMGAIIGAAASLLVTWITRRSEEQRHYREMGLQIALAKFKQHQELAQNLANRSGRVAEIPPFNQFLLHSIRLMEIVSDQRLNADQIASRLSTLDDLAEEVTKHMQQRTK